MDHSSVSCDACIKGNFKGRRYKCLICFDYDLCSMCYESGATTNQHTTSHPMQCILTRHDFDIFHAGEALTGDQPQSLTCPFCGKMGFTENTLQEHVTANHSDAAFEVVCPICASVPGGDPNHLTDDFAAHLTLDHRPPGGGARELDVSESGTRPHGVRRIPHQGRALNRGVARQNMRSVSSGFFASSSRESMDPIAELLSQLSGVRRATAATRAQQLERLPTRRTGTGSNAIQITSSLSGTGTVPASSSSNLPNGNTVPTSGGGNVTTTTQSNTTSNVVPSHHHHSTTPVLVQSSSRVQQFLLSRLGSMESDQENTSEARDRASFVQELLLSTLSELSLGSSTTEEEGDCSPMKSPTADASTQTMMLQQHLPSSPPVPKCNSTFTTTNVKPMMSKPLKAPPPPRSSQHSNNEANLGSARVVTGTGTVSVPPAPTTGTGGRGRATGGAVSPGTGRRKPVRGVESRTTQQPPPPH